MNANFRTVYELFQDQVERSPNAPCIEFGESSLTYNEVNEKANQLAHYLQRQGAAPETFIGVFLERSSEMIVSILAVLKSGAAYVPISTTYPDDRIAYIVGEANFNMILTNSVHAERVSTIVGHNITSSSKIVQLDEEWTQIVTESSTENLTSRNEPSDLAYMIYTSGSTGKPKGVMIEHRGIPNLVHEQINKFLLNHSDRVLQYASVSFDASISEIFTTLAAGATLVLLPQDNLYVGEELLYILKEKKISVVTLVPSVLSGLPGSELPHLKTLVTAGEACTRKLIQYWAPKLNFLNAYGPTETTVCATIHRCDAAEDVISLGTPISDTAVYLLNQHLQPVANGETGELYISSVGLARGYLNAEELTAKHFVSNPFNDGISDRLYRTGDLCIQVTEGVIEWVGRDDHQVKVSGIRIELGELEYALREHASIQEAVVTYNYEKNTIGAYIKKDPQSKLNISEIREYLLLKFPLYMVPTRYKFVDEFSLLTSGKIDRNNLPPMDDVRPEIADEYIAPSTYLEKELTAIWCEVLRLDKVGVHDNFFELGGQSLMATQIVSRIRGVLGMDVPLHVIFASKPTIEQTAVTLEQYQLDQMDSTELERLLAELENE
ncbi:amino acid adenylation domain-containing protein [Fontibacillus solani]|uniref:Amino acid adenylation domain-containing protein n=1 Tax=Fontibacillus solani TaxID=1572857 RepID=A0A7W3SR34_9BACL|nr:non-ribosomal peptide synthetase [Fontibacillus solani]MBA9084643.1 amino acid adenylation domain-containing protein [Fontibacillus solani]